MSPPARSDPPELRHDALRGLTSPWMVARLAQASGSPPTHRLQAVVLAADIVGYSRISERLAESHGPDGAWALSELLNQGLGRAVDAVTHFGGEVASFAGDSLLAFWPVELEAELPPATSLAAAAASAIIQALSALKPQDGLPVNVRVALSSGDCVAVALGGRGGRAFPTLLGPAVQELAGPLGAAEEGAVLLTARAAKGASKVHDLVLKERLDGFFDLVRGHRVPIPPAVQADVDLERLALPYVPSPVWAAVEAGLEGWLSEMRSATVLFAGLGPSRADADALSLLHQRVNEAQQRFDRWGGVLHHLSVDEKGVSLLGSFGLFMQGRVVGPDDAAACALELVSPTADGVAGGAVASVGVATGRVFAGLVGSHNRRSYTLIGATCNRAARLMQQGGGALVDQPTWIALSDRVETEAPVARRLKGIAEPVLVAQVLQIRDRRPASEASEEPSRAIGRGAEMGSLFSAVMGLQHGASGVVIIEGDAGMGKTHLVNATLQQARALKLPTLRFVGDPVGRRVPLRALRDRLTERLLQHPGSPAEAWRKLAVEGGLDAESADALGAALGLLPAPEAESQSAAARAAKVQSGAVMMAASIAQNGGLLLVAEDLQWMDETSLSLLPALLNALDPVLLIATRRPDEGESRAMDGVLAWPDALTIRLEALSPAATGDLLAEALEVREVPVALADQVQARTGGNPFFIKETARELSAGGWVQVRDRRLLRGPTARELETLHPGATLTGIVTARVDRLDAAAQAVLKAAAVLGLSFNLRDLEALPSLAPLRDRLRQHIETLVEHGMLERAAADRERLYFPHRITRDVAADLVVPELKRQLHRDAAERIEAQGADESAASLLAWHWARTDQPTQALPWLERCAEQAHRAGAADALVGHLSEAVAIDNQSQGQKVPAEQRAGWELRMAEAALALGEPRVIEGHARDTLRTLGLPAPDDPSGWKRLVLRGALGHLLHRLSPSWLWRVNAKRRPVALMGARAYGVLNEALSYQESERLAWMATMLQGVNLAEAGGRDGYGNHGWGGLALITNAMGLRRLADWYGARCLRTAEAEGDPRFIALACLVLGVNATSRAQWEEGERQARRLREIFDVERNSMRAANTYLWMAHCDTCRGDLDATLARARDLRTLGERLSSPRTVAWADHHRGMVSMLQGDLPRALDDLAAAHRVLDSMNDATRNLAQGGLATALARAGEVTEARTLAEALLERMLKAPTAHHTRVEGPAGAAEVLVLLAERGEAVSTDALRRALLPLEAMGRRTPAVQPRHRLLSGRVAALTGDVDGARRILDQATQQARDLHMPIELSRAKLARARLEPIGHPMRIQLAQRAAATFAAMECGGLAAFATAVAAGQDQREDCL